jgi:hypothetical protein
MSNVPTEARSDADERVALLEQELIALEGAVEFLEDQCKTFRYALCTIIHGVWGPDPDPEKYWSVDYIMKALYPRVTHVGPDGHEFRAGPVMEWRRPARRWSAYGSKAELRAIAASAGVKFTNSSTREWIVRRLWKSGAL